MRIAIDADHLYRYPLRGIQKTTLDLYRHLAQQRPTWRFDAFHQVPGDCLPLEAIAGLETKRIDIPGDRFRSRWNPWEQVRLPLAIWRHDLLHVPSNHGSTWAPRPLVLTLHDLTPLEFPTADTDRWWHAVKRSATHSRFVITCSRFVASRIAAHAPGLSGRIEVVYWGRPEGYEPLATEQAQATAARYGLDSRPYVLTFATPHPRKNTRMMVTAWLRLPARIRDAFRLVVVGRTDPSLAEVLKAEASVVVIPSVEEDDLVGMMAGASVLCYLSLSEGFGLPVLEGFTCGTPVLASNSTSIPEVAGDAALLVDPTSETDVTTGLTRLLDSPALRQELRERGLGRAQEFSWRRCADEYASIFEACVQ